jgi:hypothetical protein
VEIAAYTSAWYVRHPDGSLSAVPALAARPAPGAAASAVPASLNERTGHGRTLEVPGDKVVAEGPE